MTSAFPTLLVFCCVSLPSGALAFSSHEHQDAGDVGARAAFSNLEALHPNLRLPWRDRSGRVLVSAQAGGPAFASGQNLRGLSFGELIAIYADYIDEGAGKTTPAFDQMMSTSDESLIGILTSIGRRPGLHGKKDPTAATRQYELLAVNQRHFSDDALMTYLAWHREALTLAAKAARSGDLSLLFRAIHLDALGCHSLTDLFSTGHSILDRDASLEMQREFDALNAARGGGVEGTIAYIRGNVRRLLLDPRALRQLFAKLKGAGIALFTGFLHESYNANGATAFSVDTPRGWQTFGDSYYGKSLENVRATRTAVFRSLRAILVAYADFKTRVAPERFDEALAAVRADPRYFGALRLVPIAYRGAQRFVPPKGPLDWVKVFAAALARVKGYGSEAFGRRGGMKMAAPQTGSTAYRGLVLRTLEAPASLARHFAPGVRAVALRDPDLRTSTIPFNPVVTGLEVTAPFSNRQTKFRGVVREIYGSLARIAYKSGVENWVRVDQISAGAPPLAAPSAPNHKWKVGDRVRAPFRTAEDLVNGVVREVYGKLVRVDFVTSDSGWALGLRTRHEKPSLIPPALHPRRLMLGALGAIDRVGKSLLGDSVYAWLRDSVDVIGTRLSDKALRVWSSIEGLFSDAVHMFHRDCIRAHVPTLAAKLAREVAAETEIASSEFWGRVDVPSLAVSSTARHTVRQAWARVLTDLGTLQTRLGEDGAKKVARWYPMNAKKRAAAVAVFQRAFAAECQKLAAVLAKWGAPLLGVSADWATERR
jgi:hypothetical protein